MWAPCSLIQAFIPLGLPLPLQPLGYIFPSCLNKVIVSISKRVGVRGHRRQRHVFEAKPKSLVFSLLNKFTFSGVRDAPGPRLAGSSLMSAYQCVAQSETGRRLGRGKEKNFILKWLKTERVGVSFQQLDCNYTHIQLIFQGVLITSASYGNSLVVHCLTLSPQRRSVFIKMNKDGSG